MQHTDLPEAPPAPKRRGWAKIIIGGTLVVAVAGAIASSSTDKAPAEKATSAEQSAPACLDTSEALRLSNDAQEALTASSTAATNYDIEGMADGAAQAAGDYAGIATAMAADPAIAGPAQEASDLMYEVATLVRDGRIEEATAKLDQSTTLIDQGTAAIDATTVLPC